MVPQSTPTDTLYIERGLLDISTITTKKKQTEHGKKNPKKSRKLVAKIMDNQTKGGWKDITNKIKTEIIGEQKTETITNMDIITKFADTINKQEAYRPDSSAIYN